MRTILKPEDDHNVTSRDGRKALIRRGIGDTSRYPVFGVGINNFGRAECTISGLTVGRAYGGIRCVAPHDSYLQAGSELGVPGLLVWSSLIFGGIRAMLKLRGRLPAVWRRGNDSVFWITQHTISLSRSRVSPPRAFSRSRGWISCTSWPR